MLGFAALGLFALGEIPPSTATKIVGEPGSFAITWQTVVARPSMSAASGAFTLSGQPATLRTSMPAAAGSFALAGQSANLTAALVLTAESSSTGRGSYFGFAALGDVALGEISRVATAATFALSWQDDSSRVSMPAPAGSFVLTGSDARLVEGFVVTAERGVYALSGQNATFRVVMPAATGSYAITAKNVDFARPAPRKFRAFARVGNPTFSARHIGGVPIKIRVNGG